MFSSKPACAQEPSRRGKREKNHAQARGAPAGEVMRPHTSSLATAPYSAGTMAAPVASSSSTARVSVSDSTAGVWDNLFQVRLLAGRGKAA